jgi:predicted DNA-binding transcriptional regulator YafY
MSGICTGMLIEFGYTNHRGEQAKRRAIVVQFWYGVTEHHTDPQWFMEGFCNDRKAVRHFALKDMTDVQPAKVQH